MAHLTETQRIEIFILIGCRCSVPLVGTARELSDGTAIHPLEGVAVVARFW
jgi:hypothetical protein